MKLALWTAFFCLALGGATLAADTAQARPITGVLTSIDGSKHALTLVTPAGQEVDVTRIGKTVYVDRGVDLVSVQAKVAQNAKVTVDGNNANFSALKEGDVVRANFDPASASFISLNAVSAKQINQDVSQAQAQLGKQLDTQLGAAKSK